MNTRALRYGGRLGDTSQDATDYYGNESTPTTPAKPAATSTSIFDKINAAVSAGATTVKNVENTISSFNPSGSTPSAAANNNLSPNVVVAQPQASTGLSTGMKIGIGVGAALLLGTVILVATRKK